jgi:hypothetical protein
MPLNILILFFGQDFDTFLYLTNILILAQILLYTNGRGPSCFLFFYNRNGPLFLNVHNGRFNNFLTASSILVLVDMNLDLLRYTEWCCLISTFDNYFWGFRYRFNIIWESIMISNGFSLFRLQLQRSNSTFDF